MVYLPAGGDQHCNVCQEILRWLALETSMEISPLETALRWQPPWQPRV